MTRHPRTAARRDANEGDIVEALIALGCSVHRIYDGPFDLIVGIGAPKITVCVEVKMPGKENDLTPKERKFQKEHRGQYRIISGDYGKFGLVNMVEHYKDYQRW